MRRAASGGAGLLAILGLLCASAGCANFEVEELDFCKRNPVSCQDSGSPPAVTAVAAGGYFTLALRGDRSLSSWGDNSAGQLGDGSLTSHGTPQPIPNLKGVDRIAAGYDHALALISGTLWYWGKLPSSTAQPTPKQLPFQTDIREIAAGHGFSLALHQSGSVRAWGSNNAGRNNSSPSDVPGLPIITAIAAGDAHALALDNTGSVWVWGDNGSGQLGVIGPGSTTPSEMSGLPHIKAIAAGLRHSMALDTDGQVWVWGGNDSGELGNGDTNPRIAPELVPSLLGSTALAAGGDHSMAVDAEGGVVCWGNNGAGQLGDGRSYNHSDRPVQTVSLESVTQVSAGIAHSVALTSDGTLWAWGDNGNGQLGIVDSSSKGRVLTPGRVSIP